MLKKNKKSYIILYEDKRVKLCYQIIKYQEILKYLKKLVFSVYIPFKCVKDIHI